MLTRARLTGRTREASRHKELTRGREARIPFIRGPWSAVQASASLSSGATTVLHRSSVRMAGEVVAKSSR